MSNGCCAILNVAWTRQWALFLARLRSPAVKPFLKKMDQFYEDVRTGNLPNYTFIEPRISTNSNVREARRVLPVAPSGCTMTAAAWRALAVRRRAPPTASTPTVPSARVSS